MAGSSRVARAPASVLLGLAAKTAVLPVFPSVGGAIIEASSNPAQPLSGPALRPKVDAMKEPSARVSYSLQALAIAVFVGLFPPIAKAGDAGPPGGATTRAMVNQNAFSLPAANLGGEEIRVFALGNLLFNAQWQPAGVGEETLDGLGPTFNATSCSGCHLRDGRGRPPDGPDEALESFLVRLSLPGAAAGGRPLPDPAYGLQLNDRALTGVPVEGRVRVRYETVEGRYGDGRAYALRRPIYGLEAAAFGPPGAGLLLSPRVGQQLVGLGLLEAVPEAAVLAGVDPDDADGDGISGRANRVREPATGTERLGRFGWKANVTSLREQVADAFLNDLGITSPDRPEQNCPPVQAACRAAAVGGAPELDELRLRLMTFYVRTLAVPDRRDAAAPVTIRGEALFADAGCPACHTPTLLTGEHPVAALAGQTIHPYTDLLLHDMGEGLADGRPDFLADGREWRTPPLWGLGLIETVNGHDRLLHDGRARGVAEAILWHGGEGAAAREAFRTMPEADRAALVAFVRSL